MTRIVVVLSLAVSFVAVTTGCGDDYARGNENCYPHAFEKKCKALAPGYFAQGFLIGQELARNDIQNGNYVPCAVSAETAAKALPSTFSTSYWCDPSVIDCYELGCSDGKAQGASDGENSAVNMISVGQSTGYCYPSSLPQDFNISRELSQFCTAPSQ
jgi:hypothetical protein